MIFKKNDFFGKLDFYIMGFKKTAKISFFGFSLQQNRFRPPEWSESCSTGKGLSNRDIPIENGPVDHEI